MTTTTKPDYILGPDWFDANAESTGTSLAYAVAKRAAAQVLQHLAPHVAKEQREDIAGDLAYKIALQQRESQPLPMIVGIAVSAAFLQCPPLEAVSGAERLPYPDEDEQMDDLLVHWVLQNRLIASDRWELTPLGRSMASAVKPS